MNQNISKIIQEQDAITMEDWYKQHIVTGFMTIEDSGLIEELRAKFPLVPLKYDDLHFTGEIEDDRINTTVTFADYDWFSHTYDTRFPTKRIGTLALRFENFGCRTCAMTIHQYLPDYTTGKNENIVICHEYEFSSDVFDKYICQDMRERIANTDFSYAYNNGELMLNWYNEVLTTGEVKVVSQEMQEAFAWEQVYRPKKDRMPTVIVAGQENLG